MDKSLYLEKNISQQPAIDLLRSMGYTYISPEDCEAQRGSRYHVLLKDILRGQLRRLTAMPSPVRKTSFPPPTSSGLWKIWTSL